MRDNYVLIAESYYKYLLGNFNCVAIFDGFHDYQYEQMFRNAPPSEVESALQAHGLLTSAVHTPFTHLYVNTGQDQILVDTGAGDLPLTAGKLLENIGKAGIVSQSINAIFITHAYPDHVGGILDEHGELVFPQATYYYADVPDPSDALEFGTQGISFRAIKPV